MTSVKKVILETADWVVGPNTRDIAGDAWRRLFGSGDPEMRPLKNRFSNHRRCFVIGNGPSLKAMDLRSLANEFTIGANSFYKHPHAASIGLKFLCIFDPHFMLDESRSVEWHRTIERELPNTSLVIHELARPLVAKYRLYTGRSVYYARAGFQTRRAALVDFDFCRPRNIGMTTGSAIAIPLAVYLGFKEICLIGFDCNWLADTGASYHFYDKHEQFPEFDSIAKDGRGIGYEGFLNIIRREFESHRLIRSKAESLGVRIVNATEGGLLDAYPRASYASYFSPQSEHVSSLPES